MILSLTIWYCSYIYGSISRGIEIYSNHEHFDSAIKSFLGLFDM